MTDHQGWTYYRYGPANDRYALYYRRQLNTTYLLGGNPPSWIPRNDDRLSRYIENGESNLEETTRREIEAEIGQPLPD